MGQDRPEEAGMKKVFLDFETYWSPTHSLSKMTPIDYVMHPDTEIISCSVKVDDGSTHVYFGEDMVLGALQEIDLSDKFVIAHNMSEFDAMLLAWRLKQRPRMYGCTLAMARQKFDRSIGVSLGALVRHYGIGEKDATALINTRGKHLADFTPSEIAAMREYNRADTEQCAALFARLVEDVPVSAAELLLIDMTIRAWVEPRFDLDTELLERALVYVQAEKRRDLLELARVWGVMLPGTENLERTAEAMRVTLASAPKFAALLESRGAVVPMKPSPSNPDEMIPALAKTDEDLIALQDHPDPVVACAARTRLGVKSVLVETRIQAMTNAAEQVGGVLPVPLRYCGAVTGRWSGQLFNTQNLHRVNPDKRAASDALRYSLKAPEDHVIIVADQSGIEMRVNHFLWQVPSTMALYQDDPEADMYRAYAARRYAIEPEEVGKHQRHVSKIMNLGLGFGAWAATFTRIARTLGGLDLTLNESKELVTAWRRDFPEIVQGWGRCEEALGHIASGRERAVDPWELCWTSSRGIHLPSGRIIEYPDLRREENKEGKVGWVYGSNKRKAWVHGSKSDENIVQALARDSVAEAALRFFRETGLRFKLMVHDELVYVVPRAKGEELLARLQSVMRTPPSWWPDLVVWSEGGVGTRYGAIK